MKNLANMLERAAWTFIQTAASLVIVGGLLDLTVPTLQLALLAGGASALSVVKTYAQDRLRALNALEKA
jgi:hypothetical protein